MALITRARRFTLELVAWLSSPGTFWLTILVPLLAWRAPHDFPLSAPGRLTVTGLILELLGTYVVLAGILRTHASFGLPGLVSNYWSKRPRWKRTISLHATVGGISGAIGMATLTAGTGGGKSLTIDERVAALEERLAAEAQRISRLTDDLAKTARDLRVSIEAESKARADQFESERARARSDREAATPVDIMGIAWLVTGALFSAAAVAT